MSKESDDKEFLNSLKDIISSKDMDESFKNDVLSMIDSIWEMPPFDDPKLFINKERALFVKQLRIDEDYTLRALAGECSDAWGANWGCDQHTGITLCKLAAKELGIDENDFW